MIPLPLGRVTKYLKCPTANERMKDINEAFEILGDSAKRERYHLVWLQKTGIGSISTESSTPGRPESERDEEPVGGTTKSEETVDESNSKWFDT